MTRSFHFYHFAYIKYCRESAVILSTYMKRSSNPIYRAHTKHHQCFNIIPLLSHYFIAEKVQEYFEHLLGDAEHCRIEGEVRRVIESYCYVIAQIAKASESVGKDGQFQIFILIGVR